MERKKTTTLTGVLMRPLLVGGCARIFHGGQIIRTSTIVAIHDASPGRVCFETLNTIYTLLMNPTPQTAANPLMMSLAA